MVAGRGKIKEDYWISRRSSTVAHAHTNSSFIGGSGHGVRIYSFIRLDEASHAGRSILAMWRRPRLFLARDKVER